MAADLNKGDKVSWKAGGGTATGTVERVLTRRTKVRNRTVAASAKSPRYVVKNQKTGSTSVKTPEALRPAAPRQRKAAAAKAQEPPSESPRSWGLIAAAAALVVAALIAVYALILGPSMADDYAEKAAPAQAEVTAAMDRTFASFDAYAFHGANNIKFNSARFYNKIHGIRRALRASFAAQQKDYDAANAAIEEARETLDKNEQDLTDVGAPPLLDGVGGLGDASDVADGAEAYLSESRAFLDDYGALVAYFEAVLAADEADEAEYLASTPEPPGTRLSHRQVIESQQEEIANDRKAIERYRALEPPADVKDYNKGLIALAKVELDGSERLLDFFRHPEPDFVITQEEFSGGEQPIHARIKRAFAALHQDSEISRAITALEAQSEQLTAEIEGL